MNIKHGDFGHIGYHFTQVGLLTVSGLLFILTLFQFSLFI